MPVTASTFNTLGSAADDLFSQSSYKTKAKGYELEAQSYYGAAAQAEKNAQFTRVSTEIKDFQLQRQIYGVLGGQETAVAASGFAASGSALDILRDSASQGSLERQVSTYQGRITEEGYQQQAQAYRNMAQAAQLNAKEARRGAKNAKYKAAIKVGAAGLAAFT